MLLDVSFKVWVWGLFFFFPFTFFLYMESSVLYMGCRGIFRVCLEEIRCLLLSALFAALHSLSSPLLLFSAFFLKLAMNSLLSFKSNFQLFEWTVNLSWA